MSAARENRVDVVRDLAGFVDLAPAWDRLVEAAPRPSPFLLNAWLAAAWKDHGATGHVHIVTVSRDGELVGALPLEIVRRGPPRGGRIPGPSMPLNELPARPAA